MALPNIENNCNIAEIFPPTLARVRASLPASFQNSVHSGRQLIANDDALTSGPRFIPTLIDPIDRLLDGGLPRGRLVELTGKRSSGRFSTLLAILATATGRGEIAALVDLGDNFDPRTAASFGVDLERLLWIRPTETKTALASTELALHAGFALVVVDLGLAPVPGGRGTEAGWLRLARAATGQDSALFVSSPYRVSSTAAAIVLTVEETLAHWNGSGRAPRLLAALDGQLSIHKSRLALKSGTAHFRLLTPAGRFAPLPAPATCVQQQQINVEPPRRAAAQ